MPVGGACSYCLTRRAVNLDHVIPKSVRSRRLRKLSVIIRTDDGGHRRENRWATADGHLVPEHLLGLEPSCMTCNASKIARLLIPASWADRLDELNALGIGTFRVWDGSVEALRTVVK